ncbi:MAG: hypothetical protein AUJ52_07175 [Elusimicrobia bacterium CG1_02_63_36]|nr:MAG: hypothetical protein AUJ52_07175 [Elusimicrobia bacterium CG1_02_63_36]
MRGVRGREAAMIFFGRVLKLGFINIPIALLAALVLLAAPPHAERSRLLMGTLLIIEAPGADRASVDRAFETVAEIESWMSNYKPESELSLLNARAGLGPVPVSQALWDALIAARRAWKDSAGAFDPTFSSPGEARGFGKVAFFPRKRSVALPEGARLDLGGIGKGWALDRAAERLRRDGVEAARLDFGGQILVFSPPSGRIIRLVEIVDPACRRMPVSTGRSFQCASAASLRLQGGSVATSSNAERPGHIVDPLSGNSMADSRRSLTVAAPTATEADAWSTALFIAGPEKLPAHRGICALETGRDVVRWHGDCDEYRHPGEPKKL